MLLYVFEALELKNSQVDDKRTRSYNLLLTIKGGWLNWYKCWMAGESWHAIKKLFNPPFLILKVRHPAVVTGIYCIVRDSRSGCSNDFKCMIILIPANHNNNFML